MINLDALSIRKRDGGSEKQVLRNGRKLRDALTDFFKLRRAGPDGLDARWSALRMDRHEYVRSGSSR
jgi:hypothetical protein